jgi:hypothetical protein
VSCDGRTCGEDGCGGSCGDCAEHQECADGQCVDQPWCGDDTCDLHEDCAACPDDCPCGDDRVCVAGACESRPCEPDCVGRACGEDGCGGSCGACAKGQQCVDHACRSIEGDVDPIDVLAPDAIDVTPAPDDERARSGGSSCTIGGERASGSTFAALLAALGVLLALRSRIAGDA